MELRQRRFEKQEEDGVHLSPLSGVHKHLSTAARKIKRADMFPKPKEDYQRLQTKMGANISICTVVMISILVLWESGAWLIGRDAYHSELVIASSNNSYDKGVPINIDITFPHIRCPNLHLDLIDAAGGARIGIHHHLMKGPVTADGKLIFSKRYNSVVEHEKELGRKAMELLKDIRPFSHRQGNHSNNRSHSDENDEATTKVNPAFIQEAARVHQQSYIAENDPYSTEYCGQCYIDNIEKDSNEKDTLGEDIIKVKNKHHNSNRNQNSEGRRCCNSCQSVMDLYEAKRLPKPDNADIEQCVRDLSLAHPGCNIQGTIFVQKVKGEFHFKPGVGMQGIFGHHFHQFTNYNELVKYDPSHIINRFSIGDADAVRFHTPATSRAAGNSNPYKFPLEGLSYGTERSTLARLFKMQGEEENGQGNLVSVNYFVNIVPTAYISSDAVLSEAFEYSASRNYQSFKNQMKRGMPGVTFSFDFHSMQVNQIFNRSSLMHFLVQLCSIVGGLFVVIGLLDRAVMHYLAKS